MKMSSFIYSMVILFVIYRVFKTRFVQSLICRFLNWHPVDDAIEESRQFGRRYDAIMAQKRAQQREADRRAAARRDANNKAAFHEYQAKKYAGTNDGYWHENMAKKYRNDAK